MLKIHCCSKGKPFERMGRKASGPVLMDTGLPQQVDDSAEAHLSQEDGLLLLDT